MGQTICCLFIFQIVSNSASGPVEPSAAATTFEVLNGFRMELIAAEPLVTDPVAIAYDENGFAYVVEMHDYPHVQKEADVPFTEQTAQPPRGRVRVLEDSDGDGHFDKSTLFADQLSWPAGIALWKGGAFVGATPDIWYLKDTNGDHRADLREKVFTGFRKFNVQAVMNNLEWGLDHRIYGAASGNGGLVRQPDQDGDALRIFRRDFCFEPGTRQIEVTSGGARFGNSFNDWGIRFLCNISNPCQHVVLPNRYLQRNPHLPVPRAIHDCAESHDQLPVYPISPPEAWREARARIRVADRHGNYSRDSLSSGYVTSSSGITIYRGSAYPKEFRGQAFLGEVAGNLFYRQTLSPDGVTFTARRPDDNTEFVRSTDNWFRPVNFANAPDGTLHVLDMYREVIEHPWSVPEELGRKINFRSGSDRGRIYRLVPPGYELPAPPRLGEATTEELVGWIDSENAWHRETAHRLLYERQDRSASAFLRQLLKEGSSLGRLHALWSLEGLGELTEADLARSLGDASSGVREHAVRLAESRLENAPNLRDKLVSLATDPSPRVRFQVAFTLGGFNDGRSITALSAIARRDIADPWIRLAVLSAVPDVAGPLLSTLLQSDGFPEQPGAWPWLTQFATVVGARNQATELHEILEACSDVPAGAQMAIVAGLGHGQQQIGRRLETIFSESHPATETLQQVMQRAAVLARNKLATPAAREQAIGLLGHRPFEQVRDVLAERLDPQEPRAVQYAAVRALSEFSDADVAQILLSRWREYSPAIQSEVVQALLSRRNSLERFLATLEASEIPPGQVAAAHRRRLLNHRDAKIRTRAETLFGTEAPGPRSEVLERYQATLSLTGEGTRGRNVFRRHCMACHRFQREGHDIGPALATVRHRTPDNLLVNIIDPNREVAPDYLEYIVEMANGQITSGMVVAETAASITLRRPENVEETVLRKNVERISSTGKSIMPEGLEQNITQQDMADLIAYLLDGREHVGPSRD